MKALKLLLSFSLIVTVSGLGFSQIKKDNGVEYNETRITNGFELNTNEEELEEAPNEEDVTVVKKEAEVKTTVQVISVEEEVAGDFDKMVETRRGLRYRNVRDRDKKCYKEEEKVETPCDSVKPNN